MIRSSCKASRQELEAGAAESGKTLKEKGFRVVCWTPCSILDDGRAARSAVKAHVARILKRKLPFELDGPTMDVVNKIRQQYEYYEHMVVGTAHGEVVSDELVERFAIAGTPAEARDQLKRLVLRDWSTRLPSSPTPRIRRTASASFAWWAR